MRYVSLLLLLTVLHAAPETVYHGKVVKIADGDTLTLLVDNKQLRIRLSDIDTPERKQSSFRGQYTYFSSLSRTVCPPRSRWRRSG